MNLTTLRIDLDRLHRQLVTLGGIGALPGGGVARLALSDADRAGRDLVVDWMRKLGLQVTVDRIGNVLGLRPGESDGLPVTVGSHIDTVKAGGIYDGNLGVLAGLEVIAVLNDAGIVTKRPLAVGFFTNEEGSRFAPDMMGSAVHQGFLDLDQALAVRGIDGKSVGEELVRIGYAGEVPTGIFRAHCYFELHVEQGPVLEQEGMQIGAVEGVQGISWTEYRISGVSNHAGTTPMRMRRDAGYLAAAISVEARAIAQAMGGDQVATTGLLQFKPNLVNVIPGEAVITVDLRNTDEMLLQAAERRMHEFVARNAAAENLDVQQRVLARFEPVAFDPVMVDLVEREAHRLGYSVRRMPSGAGHDAQMFAPNCPTAMIFVPSVRGISHNPAEFTTQDQIGAGAQVLLGVVLEQAMK
ncbi:MAG: M20 family metallo-hydrolase [Gammaproteobacteria bacterium]|nr:M20 family metallo-hydrolase [Gammaproteobacteria bacterium]MCP5417080.1 M20 family metallo-hydrolase [Chromatiaceae bacterium]